MRPISPVRFSTPTAAATFPADPAIRMVHLVIVTVSAALLLGAWLGLSGKFPLRLEGFLLGLAGGALLLSAVTELLQPAVEKSTLPWVLFSAFLGASVFSGIDYLIDERFSSDSGGSLLAAVTLDGIPENLALGVALISMEPMAAFPLAGSIFLSNLPEAAAGAREMKDADLSKARILATWGGAALVLSASAIIGHQCLRALPGASLANIGAFAGGAVIASLATEIFPKAFQKENHFSGIAAISGVLLTFLLQALH